MRQQAGRGVGRGAGEARHGALRGSSADGDGRSATGRTCCLDHATVGELVDAPAFGGNAAWGEISGRARAGGAIWRRLLDQEAGHRQSRPRRLRANGRVRRREGERAARRGPQPLSGDRDRACRAAASRDPQRRAKGSDLRRQKPRDHDHLWRNVVGQNDLPECVAQGGPRHRARDLNRRYASFSRHSRTGCRCSLRKAARASRR